MTFVFTNGNYFAAVILNQLLQKHKDSIKVVLVKGDYYGNSKKKALVTALNKVPLKFIIYKVFIFFGLSLIKIFKPGDYSVKDLCKKYNIETFECENINTLYVKEILLRNKADYLVSVSCPQIVKKDILLLFNSTINIHSSLLPKYAGLAPYFWVLNNGEKFTGTTVHYMVSKLDEGNVIVQDSLEIDPNWSMFTLFIKLSELGSICLLEGYEKMINKFEGKPQDLLSKTYYNNPTKNDLNNFKNLGKHLIKLRDCLNLKSI